MAETLCHQAMFFLPLIASFSHVQSYKILLVPLPARSHVNSLAVIANGLADRGHTVSFLIGESFRLSESTLKERTDITFVSYKDPMDADGVSDYDQIAKVSIQDGHHATVPVIKQYSVDLCIAWTMDSDDILDRLQKERFDLAVVDGAYCFECIFLIPHRLHVPWIAYSDFMNPMLVRTPWLPSFTPITFLPFADNMTFMQRLGNSLVLSWIQIQFIRPRLPPEIIDKYQQYGAFNSLDDLASKSLLWMYPKDNIGLLDYPRPSMPNIVDIGGLTVKPPTVHLLPAIKQFIEGGKKGTILTAFGSSAASFPVAIDEKFISAFSRLDGYRVVWKTNNTHKLKIPDNMLTANWLPQNDILAHPATKLFITHCGNNGQYEAVNHGVPMLGMPLYGDQMSNAKRLDYKGYGLSMNIHDFTADELYENIHRILGDKSYKERVTKASEIFRNQPQSPVERATFWIEHVCRFGGDHLRSAGNDLPLYSYFMLDILACILFILCIFVYILYRIVKFILNGCRRTGKGCTRKNKSD